MPELPEVETIKLGLQKKIIGLKIKEIKVLSPKSFIGNPNKVEGLEIQKIWRKAKILGIDLGEITLLFHMKMSGQLVFDNGKRPASNASRSDAGRFIGGHPTPDMVGQMPNPHTRVIFTFSDNTHLYFNDQRKFGWVKIVDQGSSDMDQVLKGLGPEPLEKEFTWEILKQNLLRHKSMPVKVAIMDQSVVSGVGNIYSNEACFNAKLDPRTKVNKLTDEQFKKLYSGIKKALEDGIKYGGSTRTHFVDPEGRKGYFLDYANVYGKEGYACKGCPGKVEKIALGGRGTYFCSSCQK